VRRILIVAFPDVQPLDVVGPAEVFSIATRLADRAYEVRVVAPGGATIATGAGYGIAPDGDLSAGRGALDTLLVAGGLGVPDAVRDEALVEFVRRTAARARRVASVCTGAFLLAEAGVLDGRRATTHWAACAELRRRHPAIAVEPDPIFVADGHVRTSAGVTAGMDLALALVEEDLGARLALEVARWLVLFVRRPGGQAQFSAALSRQAAEREPIAELQAWMVDHLDADLSVPALAERAFMSPRNFARVFRREVGATPAEYVERLRVERARLLLETTAEGVEAVARACGFGTVETLRRAFARCLGVSPGAYRSRFAA
jgi:transcriptional regulator GlxA family with amidase domain